MKHIFYLRKELRGLSRSQVAKMLVRKLRPEELWQARLVQAVAFEGSFDLAEEKEKCKAGSFSEDAAYEKSADYWAAFGEGESPCACLVMNHFQARFDGHVVGLGGVGGVASLPANRRGGAVRACMQEALRGLYRHGDALSALYPFSTGYYQKFGYANGVESRLWEVPMGDLPQGDFGGRVRQLFPGEDLAPLLAVYNAFYQECNLSVLREAYDKELLEKDLLKEKRYIYLWEDEKGEPGAFCIAGRDGDALDMRTDFSARNGFLFRDARGFQALLSFIRRAFLSNFKTVRFALPAWAAVAPLLPECAHMKQESFFNGMVRAVNVEKLLGLCACKGDGVLTLEAADPLLEENNAVFRLSFQEGTENQVERVREKPDIRLGTGELGALLCGVHSVEALRWMPQVKVENPAAPLAQVFYPKPCHVTELF